MRSIAVGGNASLGSTSTNSNVQFTNSLSWLSMDGLHKLTLTTNASRNFSAVDQVSNLLGSFTFNSLGDFQAGAPASFTRTLTPLHQGRSQTLYGMALGDYWRVDPDLTVQYGVRVDGSRFGSGADYNPLIMETFGLRNDRVPNPVGLSPRVSFNKSIGEAPQITFGEGFIRGPRQRIGGGFGFFQGAPAQSLLNRVISNTGLPTSIQTLSCVGAAAPVPQWSEYRTDPASVPSTCVDGSTGSVFADAQPNVTIVDPGYQASRRMSADLNWSGWVLQNRFNLSVAGSYALNLDQQGEIDLNFLPQTRFALADEDNRPVFVSPTSIVPETGAIATGDARVSQDFSHVTFVRSNLRSSFKQIVFQLSPTAFNSNFNWNLSYTRVWSRRLLQGFGSTVGNPLDLEWADNDINAKHQVQLRLNYNLFNTFRINWTVAARSGTVVTPRIAGDVNGDGYSNDRAFVFDPAHTADTALASAMRQLLTTGSPVARDCLGSQLGRLAGLNSCRGPWAISTNSVNVTLNPLSVHMPQRAQVRFQLSNPFGAADLLMHGAANPHGWGQSTAPDQTLLYVRGFDPATNRFTYDVNQHFGSTAPRSTASRTSPVTLTALLSIDLSPPRERQSLTQMLDRGRKYPEQEKAKRERAVHQVDVFDEQHAESDDDHASPGGSAQAHARTG